MNTKTIQEALKSKIRQGVCSGCSLIFGKPNQKMLEIHEGQIGRKISQPINAQTKFDLQSITKAVVTGPLTLKLVQKGQISLEDPIGPFLKSLGVQNADLEKVTFKDLLTHSSGLSDGDLSGSFETPAALWKHMLSAKPQFTPGSSIEYSDLGYRILGKILEQILGTTLEQAAQDLLWKPLKLKNMSYLVPDNSYVAATPDAHGIIDDEQVHFLGDVLGCDGVFSNAEDLYLFMSALLTHDKELSQLKQSTRSFERSYESFFDVLAFGGKSAGWEVNTSPFSYAGPFHGKNTFEKAGGAGTFIWFDADSRYIFVYLTNHGKPKPFDDQTWNELLKQVGPAEISKLIYENL